MMITAKSVNQTDDICISQRHQNNLLSTKTGAHCGKHYATAVATLMTKIKRITNVSQWRGSTDVLCQQNDFTMRYYCERLLGLR